MTMAIQRAHVFGLVRQKDDCEEKHQDGTYQPILDERKSQHPFVPEDIAHLFVPDLRERRVHHQDQADCDRNVGRSDLKSVNERLHPRYEVAERDTDAHREKDPHRKETVKKA
jgi:hypothetical protein